MSKLTQIQSTLENINPAKFQQMCDTYIYKKFGFKKIKAVGTASAKEKTAKGTPDSIFQGENNSSYIFAQHTTDEHNLFKKVVEDLEKCFDELKTKISTSKIEKIILCFNGKLSINDEKEIFNKGIEKKIQIEIIDIDTLSFDLFSRFPRIAKDFLDIDVDTGQILDIEDFIQEYQKNKFATPLDTKFYFREAELSETLRILEDKDVTVITGKAGLGKSRLAIETMYEFVKANPQYITYCIFNREGISLFNDLKDYFNNDGNYLIFIDDANRVSELQHILRLLKDKSEYKNFKIIITVRDYALDKIKNWVKAYEYNEISLQLFDRNKLRIFLSEEFKITNHLYLERIENISEGNPRIAVMAAIIASETNRLDSIFNVEGIYDEYFSSITKDLESFDGRNLLKVAGLISFFRVIKLKDKEFLKRIEDAFGTTQAEILESVIQLHKMEVVELYENEVVKISDQILSNYLFYKTFFKDTILSFSALLQEFFESHKNLIIEAIYPAIDAFDSSFLKSQLQPHIDEKWEQIKNDEELLFNFIEVFFPFKETESLLFLMKMIDEIPAEFVELSQLNFEPDEHKPLQDELLETLVLFHQAAIESYKISLDLLFLYLEKRPSLLPQVLNLIVKTYCFDRHSNLQKYAYETALIERLIQKAETEDKKEFYKRILLAIIGKYLGLVFNSNSSKGMTVTIYTYGLEDCPEIIELRRLLWQELFTLYQEEEYQVSVLDILSKYFNSWHEDKINKEIVRKDSEELIPFIKSNLNPHSYEHCHIVHEYIFFLEKLNISYDENLKSMFSSESYEIAQIIIDRRFKLYEESGYENWHKRKVEIIKQKLGKCDFDDYVRFFDICEQIINFDKSNEVYQLDTTILAVLIDLAETNPPLFEKVIHYTLATGNPLNFSNYGIHTITRKIIDISSTPKDAYDFLKKYDYKLKPIWIACFFCMLLPNEIDEFFIQELVEFNRTTPNMTVDFEYLRKYEHLDDKIIIKIIKIVWERVLSGGFHFNFFYLLHGDLQSKLSEIFADDLDILKQIYFYQQNSSNHDDYDRKIFNKIYELDSYFIYEYFEYLYKKNDFLSDYERNGSFSFLWKQDNYEEEVNNILDFCFGKQKPPYWHRNYPEILFSKIEDEEISIKVKEFLIKYIQENSIDINKMEFIFQIISDNEYLYSNFKEFLETFVLTNKNFEDFQRLPLHPSSGTMMGSRIPYYEKDIEFYEALLPIFNTIELIKHKNYIKKRIQSLRKEIQEDLKREFIESAFR